MKLLTLNQLRFAAIFAITNIVFRIGMSRLLDAKEFTWAWVVAALFAVIAFSVGWYFGRKDHESLPIYDVGFRFHLTTYVLHNLIAEGLHLFSLNSVYETIETVHLTALFWGVFILLHFVLFMYTRKNAIKGISKTDIFE